MLATNPSEPRFPAISERSARWVTEPTDRWTYFVYVTILATFAVTAYYQTHGIIRHLIVLADQHKDLKFFLYPSLLWTLMGTLLFVFRTFVWVIYRPFSSAARQDAPRLTVVIPAYNEGAMVLQSIESVARADYPSNRLQILVVDDGSRDDTWQYISQAADRYPELVTALRHDRNRGKREALALGFERARGDIIVTLDSDSVIEPGALLALAGPFRDERVGAVAGKVLVYNRYRGLIPRMLHVRYVLSFDFLRCVESVYGNVFCCPGALTALRASAIRPLLERWKTQRFLGARCTFGEDRAMTNFVLEAGYDTVYQRSAVVHTTVPETYSKLCKMLIRWDRSYVREEIRFARIVWTRPLWTRVIALFDRFVTNLRFPVYYTSLGLLPLLAVSDPRMIARMLAAMGFVSLLNMLYYLRSERSPDFLYGVLYAYFSSFSLFWIFPYAAATVRARSWLTR
jgi:hyaluronan synthase